MQTFENTSSKKVYVQTWGCQMNVADSERMLALLKRENYEEAQTPEESDLILLNTCHIREKATHKVLSQLGLYKRLKARKPGLLLAVAGCVAQLEARRLKQSCPEIDLIFGPDQLETLPDLLKTAQEQAEKTLLTRTEWDPSPEYNIPIDVIPPWRPEEQTHVTRFVNIIKGCNNFCTFCVVPFTRGREKSRLPEQILEESRWHLERGTREIVLLGQNVNSYGLDLPRSDWGSWTPFTWLLLQTARLPGLKWLRFTTSNPHDFTPHIAAAFQEEPRLANAFHLPLQSGSDRILERMKRKYSRQAYLEKVEMLRKARSEIALSTDIIVGFPGETEKDFLATLDLLEKVRYSHVFAFKYSPRKGTGAARFRDAIDEKEKSRRLQELFEIQKRITREINESFQNQEVEVLLQYRHKNGKAWYGRTYEGRLVKVNALPEWFAPAGESVQVSIDRANETALEGHFLRRLF